jgi:hypothetical protein
MFPASHGSTKGLHVPVEHASQVVALHALSQQMPLTQNPERHWLVLAHEPPFSTHGTHWPARQWLAGCTHAPSEAHEVGHDSGDWLAEPLHATGR